MSEYFTTSEAGYDLILRFEGLHKVRPDGLIEAYKIGNDLPTIGIGQTGKMPDGRPVQLGLVITRQEAEDALQYFVRNVTEPLVRKHFNARTQSEFDALVSWTYNVSAAKLERGEYSLPQLVNQKARDDEALVRLWMRYVRTPGFENGLTKRRLAEILMFLGLPWSAPSVWGYISTARYKTKAGVVDPTDPFFIIEMAEAAVPIFSEPDPPKAPEPVVPVEVVPLPEVPPAVDPTLPPKKIEESKTGKAVNRASRGKETVGISTIGALLAGLATQIQTIGDALENIGTDTMIRVAMFGFICLAGAGAYMWWSGRNEAYHRRLETQDPKY